MKGLNDELTVDLWLQILDIIQSILYNILSHSHKHTLKHTILSYTNTHSSIQYFLTQTHTQAYNTFLH